MHARLRASFALLALARCAPSPCPEHACLDAGTIPDGRAAIPDASDHADRSAPTDDIADANDVVDPRADAAADVVTDSQGGFVLLPTDTLAPHSPALIAGSLSDVCIVLDVLRDGARFALPEGAISAVSVRTSDAAVARAATARECASVGVVTLSAGQITVEADVLVQSRTLPVRYSLRVLDEPVSVVPESLLTGTMHVGEPRSFSASSARPSGANAGGLHPEWLRIAASAPVISIASSASGRWTVTGRALGEATLEATYGPPGREQTVRAAAPIRIVTPGALVRVEEVLFRYASGEESARFGLEPGACADLALRAWYQSSPGVTYWATTTDATFDAAGATRIDGGAPAPRVCAAQRGEATIRGCIGGLCRDREEFVSSPGARFALEPASITAARLDSSASRACVALRGSVLFLDGERVALPFARLTRAISLSQSRAPYASIPHAIEPSAPDELCFRAATPDNEYVFQSQAYQFAARIPVTVR